MSLTVVRCMHPDCQEKAQYKIAALWSDGRFRELKSYGHACMEHFGELFREADERWIDTPRAPGETIESVGIYRFREGLRDALLERLWRLEETHMETSDI